MRLAYGPLLASVLGMWGFLPQAYASSWRTHTVCVNPPSGLSMEKTRSGSRQAGARDYVSLKWFVKPPLSNAPAMPSAMPSAMPLSDSSTEPQVTVQTIEEQVSLVLSRETAHELEPAAVQATWLSERALALDYQPVPGNTTMRRTPYTQWLELSTNDGTPLWPSEGPRLESILMYCIETYRYNR